MICPYCRKPMTRYGEDTYYWYYRCKNMDCPKPGHENMQPKDDPEWEQEPIAAAERRESEL